MVDASIPQFPRIIKAQICQIVHMPICQIMNRPHKLVLMITWMWVYLSKNQLLKLKSVANLYDKKNLPILVDIDHAACYRWHVPSVPDLTGTWKKYCPKESQEHRTDTREVKKKAYQDPNWLCIEDVLYFCETFSLVQNTSRVYDIKVNLNTRCSFLNLLAVKWGKPTGLLDQLHQYFLKLSDYLFYNISSLQSCIRLIWRQMGQCIGVCTIIML